MPQGEILVANPETGKLEMRGYYDPRHPEKSDYLVLPGEKGYDKNLGIPKEINGKRVIAFKMKPY